METCSKGKKARPLPLVFLVCWIIVGVFAAPPIVTAEPSPVIITHTKVSDISLSCTDIKNIFLGKKATWSDGQQITFVILNSGDVHKAFLKYYVKKNPSQFLNYWRHMLFTGKGMEPKAFNSEQALMEYVAAHEGVIGYISNETPAVGVRVMPITD